MKTSGEWNCRCLQVLSDNTSLYYDEFWFLSDLLESTVWQAGETPGKSLDNVFHMYSLILFYVCLIIPYTSHALIITGLVIHFSDYRPLFQYWLFLKDATVSVISIYTNNVISCDYYIIE